MVRRAESVDLWDSRSKETRLARYLHDLACLGRKSQGARGLLLFAQPAEIKTQEHLRNVSPHDRGWWFGVYAKLGGGAPPIERRSLASAPGLP